MPGEDKGDLIGQVAWRLESSESRERYSRIGQDRTNKKGILVPGKNTGDQIRQVAWRLATLMGPG